MSEKGQGRTLASRAATLVGGVFFCAFALLVGFLAWEEGQRGEAGGVSLGLGVLVAAILWAAGTLIVARGLRRIAAPIGQVAQSLERLVEGKLESPVKIAATCQEVSLLARALDALHFQLREYVELTRVIERYSLVRPEEALGGSTDALRTLVRSLGEIFAKFSQLSQSVGAKAAEIAATTQQQQAGAAQQEATFSEVAATMQELAATARQIAENATSVTGSAERAVQVVDEGRRSLVSLAEAIVNIQMGNDTINNNIAKLRKQVDQIGGITDLINSIADRSDLLALNAALEGTKAGEAGKGFLLVAQEMRRLAENVFSSTQEIKKLVQEVTEATNETVLATESAMRATKEGVDRAEQAEIAFNRIVETILENTQAAKQISSATQQQRTGTDQIVTALQNVAEVVSQWVVGLQTTSRAVGDLNAVAAQLRSLVPDRSDEEAS